MHRLQHAGALSQLWRLGYAIASTQPATARVSVLGGTEPSSLSTTRSSLSREPPEPPAVKPYRKRLMPWAGGLQTAPGLCFVPSQAVRSIYSTCSQNKPLGCKPDHILAHSEHNPYLQLHGIMHYSPTPTPTHSMRLRFHVRVLPGPAPRS